MDETMTTLASTMAGLGAPIEKLFGDRAGDRQRLTALEQRVEKLERKVDAA